MTHKSGIKFKDKKLSIKALVITQLTLFTDLLLIRLWRRRRQYCGNFSPFRFRFSFHSLELTVAYFCFDIRRRSRDRTVGRNRRKLIL